MLDAWRRERWKHTSAIMWASFQARSTKKIPTDQFNPYHAGASSRAGIRVTPANIQALKCFLPRKV